MKLSVDLRRLERARESIGAAKATIERLSVVRNPGASPIEIELLDHGSIVLSGDELVEALRFPGGLAAIGDTQITLHIFQPFNSQEALSQTPAPDPKFHVSDCRTLKDMRGKGRYDRYVATTDPKGLFRVQPWDHITKVRGEEMEARLAPCKNCLVELNYDGFGEKTRWERDAVVRDFDLKAFLENYEPVFRCLPLFTPENFPEGNYTKDWARVSEDFRRNAGWICWECNIDLSDNRRLLHVHHKDGNRGNNNHSNLVALCCVCHQQQPFHNGIHIDGRDRNIILELREKRGQG